MKFGLATLREEHILKLFENHAPKGNTELPMSSRKFKMSHFETKFIKEFIAVHLGESLFMVLYISHELKKAN
jgi:hypothetical protein